MTTAADPRPPRTTHRPPSTAPAAAPAGAASPPPSLRNRALRWIGVSVLLLLAAAALAGLGGSGSLDRIALDPESTSPEGAKALTAILQSQGISVELALGETEARRLLETGADATLVMSAPKIASDAALENARDLANQAALAVFVTANEHALHGLALGEYVTNTSGRFVSEPAAGGCGALDLSGVGEIAAAALFEPAPGVTACFTNGAGQGALLFTEGSAAGHPRLALLEASTLFDNAHLAENGNAALAFALLGGTGRVVWYQPSPADLALDRTGTLAALTPQWVTPVMLLLLVTTIVAAIVNGRRFGPLVAERLPVTVRASETMLGRARLTARASDSAHAAAALRAGAMRRLGKKLGLSHQATPAQLAHAVSEAPELGQLLTGALPATDAELVSFARALGAILDRIDPLPAAERGLPDTHPSHPEDPAKPAGSPGAANSADERSIL